MSSSETYFVAATIVTQLPTSARTRSYAARLAGPAVREEELRVARRAEIDALDVLDARRAQRPLRRRPEIEVPPVQHVFPERSREGLRHLGADLVAAGADRGPDRRVRAAAQGSHALRDDTCQEATPTRVQDGHARPDVTDPGERDR